MFDIAQAALLRADVNEDKLPRTHSGVIEAFRRHAVQSGQIDRELATQLSRTESLRIKADYTGTVASVSRVQRIEIAHISEDPSPRASGGPRFRYYAIFAIARPSLKDIIPAQRE
jgi:uncharacterized protein (UPF0332 family)